MLQMVSYTVSFAASEKEAGVIDEKMSKATYKSQKLSRESSIW
jgi:hypothetical protein